MKGKIFVFIGEPMSGKSFLANLLREEYDTFATSQIKGHPGEKRIFNKFVVSDDYSEIYGGEKCYKTILRLIKQEEINNILIVTQSLNECPKLLELLKQKAVLRRYDVTVCTFNRFYKEEAE